MKTIATLAAVATLSACATVQVTAPAAIADPTAGRAMAVTRASLDGTTLDNGVTVTTPIATAFAECIAEHATEQELATLAANVDEATTDATISAVLARPETVGCATNALT